MMSGAAAADRRKAGGQANPESLDLRRIRADFPALNQQLDGKALVYLDSAASAHKPRQVIEAIATFYSRDYANIHRGAHALSSRATEAYEGARETIQRFVNATQSQEIVFTRGCTEAINLVASTWGEATVQPGDQVLVTEMEHHSNLVPWQQLCAQRQARLAVLPIDERGDLLLERLDTLLTPRTKLVALTHVSNVLGTINPVRQIVDRCHAAGARVLIDGAQSVAHLPVDVQQLDCDFYAFSGHKLYGPTGIGVLYGKRELLDAMSPYQTGGGMVDQVSFEGTTFIEPPLRFEAGTPNIAGAVGLAAAVDYVSSLSWDAVARHEHDLLAYATAALQAIDGLQLFGTSAQKSGVLSFSMQQAHPYDIGTVLDQQGLAIRVGHHCAQPLMTRLGVTATARASLGVYSTRDDIDALVRGLHKVVQLFA